MAEFGRPAQSDDEEEQEEKEHQVTKPEPLPISHDEVRLPVRTSPSPAPFAEYAPIRVLAQTYPPAVTTKPEDLQHAPPEEEEDKDGSGCCKCIIM